MAQLFVRHSVEDFDKWYKIFSSEVSRRYQDAGGISGTEVYRSVDDPNDVTIIQTFESTEAAKSYFSMSGLGDRMKAAGVIGRPTVWITEEF